MSDIKHIVALSGGKDSTAMAIMLSRMEPRDYIYICTPTGDESEEMIAHWAKLEELLSAKLTMIRNHSLKFWINEFKALPNWRQRWCTRLLKIEPTLAFLKANMPCIQYVGLRVDEEERGGIYSSEIPQRFFLREIGFGISEVIKLLKEEGINIPRRTDCLRCYGQRI